MFPIGFASLIDLKCFEVADFLRVREFLWCGSPNSYKCQEKKFSAKENSGGPFAGW